MESLNLQLVPVCAVSSWLEEPEFLLVLQNPNEYDVPIPSDWYAGARIGIFHPDGERTMILPFGDGPDPAAPPDEILEHSDRERRFTLRSAVLPGLYVIMAKLAFGTALQATTRWFLEAPRPLSIAVSSVGGLLGQRAWILASGVKQSTLFQAPIAWCDSSDPRVVWIGSPGRESVEEAAARGLVACALPSFEREREHGRVAWLCGQNLTVGTTAVLFDKASVRLPDAASRILSPLLVKEDGTCDIFVLSEDGLAIWVFRGGAAVPHVEEADGPPFIPGADVPIPELTGTISLSFPFTAGAVAAGPNYSALVMAADASWCIEVLHQTLDYSAQPRVRNRARIEKASLIPGCQPWIAVDEAGRTRVAVLFYEPGPEIYVGLAKLVFDDDGEPVWVEAVGRQRLGVLRDVPLDGALAAGGETGWPLAWCVRTAGGELVGSIEGSAPSSRKIIEKPMQPLVFLATLERLAVATESDHGIGFVSI